MKYLLVLIFVFSFEAEGNLVNFCFDDGVSLKSASHFVQPILLPSEVISFRRSLGCLEIEVKKNYRQDLITNYLNRKFKVRKVFVPSQGEDRFNFSRGVRQCRFQLIQTEESTETSNSIAVGKKNSIEQTEKLSSGKTISDLIVGEGLVSTLKVDGSTLWIKCLIQSSSEYLLNISFSSNFSAFSTTVSIKRGVPLQLGEVVKNLTNQNKSLSSSQGISQEKSMGNKKINYLLKML